MNAIAWMVRPPNPKRWAVTASVQRVDDNRRREIAAMKRLRDRIAAVRVDREFFEVDDYMRIIGIGRWGALRDIGDAHKAGLLTVQHYGPGNRVRAVYEIT